jgi:hypothetical protein
MQKLIDLIKRRKAHTLKRIESYKESGGDNYHAGWSLGYWEGRLSAFDDVLDEIDNEMAKAKCNIDCGCPGSCRLADDMKQE